MIHDSYISHFITVPPVILGVPMNPLSLFHLFLLDAFKLMGNETTFNDFVLSVWICSQTFEQLETSLKSLEHLKPEIGKQYFENGKQWGNGINNKTEFAESIAREIVRFEDYIKSSLTLPPKGKTGDEKSFRSPWQLAIKNVLMEHQPNKSESDIWNQPVQKSLTDYYSICELQGDETLMDEFDMLAKEQFGKK